MARTVTLAGAKLELIRQILGYESLDKLHAHICREDGISRGTRNRLKGKADKPFTMYDPAIEALCGAINRLAEGRFLRDIESEDWSCDYERFARGLDPNCPQIVGDPATGAFKLGEHARQKLRDQFVGTYQVIRPFSLYDHSFVLELMTFAERDGRFYIEAYSHQNLKHQDVYTGEVLIGPRYLSTMLQRSETSMPAFRGLFVHFDEDWNHGWFNGLMTRGMAGRETKDLAVVSMPFVALKIGEVVDIAHLQPRRIKPYSETEIYVLDHAIQAMPALSGCVHAEWYKGVTSFCEHALGDEFKKASDYHPLCMKSAPKWVSERNPHLNAREWKAIVKDLTSRLGYIQDAAEPS